MRSFETLDEAREAAGKRDDVMAIVEIEPGEGALPYVLCKVHADVLQRELRRKPMPEIRRVVREAVDLERERREEREAALERNVPGVLALMEWSDRVYDDQERYCREFSRMMEDEDNDGARPPKRTDEESARRLRGMVATNPRAALYLRAKRQAESAHWADNTGKGAAGQRAMGILASGGSIADAQVALVARREWTD